jgi:signal transduction histidine kinase
VVLAAAAVLFAGIFFLRQGTSDGETGIALLYLLPAALIGLELGRLAGLAAAVLATGLLVFWDVTTPVELGALGVATRGAAFAGAGLIAGRFSDRMRKVYLTQASLLDAGLELARLEEADALGELVARRALTVPGVRGVRVALDGAEPLEAGRVGTRPLSFTLEGHSVTYGTLDVDFRGGAEQEAALAMLALQASVACENQRLLDAERERARLQAALGDAQGRLAERGAQLRALFAGQERERTEVAHELHEEAAQALAAVLLGLEVVGRDLDSELAPARLERLRNDVRATLGSVRELAVSLRPPVLDGVGLAPALERLAGDGHAPGLRRVVVDIEAANGRLAPDTEAAIYRVAEEAIRATAGRREAYVRYHERTGEVSVAVRSRGGGTVGDLAALRARVELLDGSVENSPPLLEARIALRDQAGAA